MNITPEQANPLGIVLTPDQIEQVFREGYCSSTSCQERSISLIVLPGWITNCAAITMLARSAGLGDGRKPR